MSNTLTHPQNIFVEAYTSIQDFVAKVSKRKSEVKKIRDAIKQLNSMSDRDLLDIGISRYDIEMIVKGIETK